MRTLIRSRGREAKFLAHNEAMLAALAFLAASIQNPLTSRDTFPIAVWLQEPSNAARYKAAGFNLYVGLWEGPTEQQLATLKQQGMPVVCEQNATGLNHVRDPIIAAWMHQDEPDNAQPAKEANGKPTWGPCVPPQRIVDAYKAMKAKDPSRPVMLNLGQGVANDQWYGRGNGAKLDDYKTYVLGGDVVSFDIYPVASFEDGNHIPLIAKGLDRLHGWAPSGKRIWNCLECTAISGAGKATPEQVRCEAWLSIVHGSTGLIYFVHQFKPKFDEHALLYDKEMLTAVTNLNAEIQSYAPAILRGSTLSVSATGADVLAKSLNGKRYLFLVNPTASETQANVRGFGKAAGATGDLSAGISLPPYGVRLLHS